jgi:hypothetical protein
MSDHGDQLALGIGVAVDVSLRRGAHFGLVGRPKEAGGLSAATKMCITVRLERSLNEGGRAKAKAVMLLDQRVLRFPTHILWS